MLKKSLKLALGIVLTVLLGVLPVFAMGDDWEGKFDFLKKEGVEVVYLPRTPEISTTQIKTELGSVRESKI